MTTRNGVCVGLYHNDRILVVRTTRHPDVWQPIGGGLDGDETPAQAAVREIFEETGWTIDAGDLTPRLELPMDAHPGTLTFYTATAPTHTPTLDDTEIVEARWVTADEARQLNAFPAARQFFTLLAGGH